MYIVSGTKFYGRKGVAPWVVVWGVKAFPCYSKQAALQMISDMRIARYV